jgi:hypothetical protein
VRQEAKERKRGIAEASSSSPPMEDPAKLIPLLPPPVVGLINIIWRSESARLNHGDG